MKERLVTFGLAVCALALFYVLMFPKPGNTPTAPHPLTSGADGEGYLAVWRWLAAAHVPTQDLHRRFDHLDDAAPGSQPTGNLLIITLPFAVDPHPEELALLDSWIARGNILLVLAALDDTPLWSAITDNFVPQLQRLSRIEFTAKPQSDPKIRAQPGAVLRAMLTPAGREIELRPSGHIPLLEGVNHLATRSPLPSTQWQVRAMDETPVLELARRADTADQVLWLKPSGKGALIVSAYASVFNNTVIGKSDNAHLMSNHIAWSLQPGGRVLFDDGHQGAMDE